MVNTAGEMLKEGKLDNVAGGERPINEKDLASLLNRRLEREITASRAKYERVIR